MDRFLEDAEGVFETAMAAAEADLSHTDVAILLDSNRAIRIVDSTGWQLDALRVDYGASAVYRVMRRGSGVCVEGRSGQRSCSLRSEHPNETARTLLNTRFPGVQALPRPALCAPNANQHC